MPGVDQAVQKSESSLQAEQVSYALDLIRHGCNVTTRSSLVSPGCLVKAALFRYQVRKSVFPDCEMSPHLPGCGRPVLDDIVFTKIGVNEASTPATENVAGVDSVMPVLACVQYTPEEVEETSLLLWGYSRQHCEMGFVVKLVSKGSLVR